MIELSDNHNSKDIPVRHCIYYRVLMKIFVGAGDTFVACVIASLIKGRSLKTALETGCRIAAKKIGQRGFQNLGDLFF